MAIPRPIDRDMAALDDYHALIMTRLRNWRYAAADKRDAQGIRSAAQDYVYAIVNLVNTYG